MDAPIKIFSDPTHGFISVPEGLLLRLLESPEVQRLRRIRQLGVGHLVFPNAEHTRFGHALGAMALMQDALKNLRERGTPISSEEHRAALAAALLHDIGHSPYSHSLETVLIPGFQHERMSRALMAALNAQMDHALDPTLAIFDGVYPRPFFHQLVSSQLDMDRLDYLRRDSFFTGVAEGVVGVERIIKTMRVYPADGGASSQIVLDEKGAYAAENFILSRRMMYWQVYLHKTVLAGDHLLRSVLGRARTLYREGSAEGLEGSASLLFFLQRELSVDEIERPDVQAQFCRLDDTDIVYTLKTWMDHPDPLLSDLARRFIHRVFFRVAFVSEEQLHTHGNTWRSQVEAWLRKTFGLSASQAEHTAGHYLLMDHAKHSAYAADEQPIQIIDLNQVVRELSETSDAAAVAALTSPVIKPYVSYPKEVSLHPAPR